MNRPTSDEETIALLHVIAGIDVVVIITTTAAIGVWIVCSVLAVWRAWGSLAGSSTIALWILIINVTYYVVFRSRLQVTSATNNKGENDG